MRSLNQALSDHELIVLRVMGEWWELDLTGSDKATCVQQLAVALARLNMAEELMYLPPEEARAVDELVRSNGRVPVAAFEREYGEVRLMGPGALERDEPWLDPVSVTEALWYRGFLFRGFDETAEGMIEFYYLPKELTAQFAPAQMTQPAAAKTAVTTLIPVEINLPSPPDITDAVDDLTTLLALAQKTALRSDKLDQLHRLLLNPDRHRRSLLVNLAREMGMLRETEDGVRPTRTAVSWLQQSREQQLLALVDAWSESGWNDLCHTPGLSCEGENWHNDPILARTSLLDALPRGPKWYDLEELVQFVHTTDPDFQRPDGNYDIWYIREEETDSYLTGFDSWPQVEGRLLRFLVEGPMVWLGLAVTAVAQNRLLFKLTDRALEWLAGTPPSPAELRVPLIVQPDASIIVPHSTGRYERFQAARISEAEPVQPGEPFRYRMTPCSLQEAKETGISLERILEFLTEAGQKPLPPSTKRCLTRWGEHGTEGRLEAAVILRVRDAAILDTLRNNAKTREFMGQSLGDLAVVVRQDQWEALRAAVAQLGLLLDMDM